MNNRNRKSGLDYFPLDSFFMSDTKIKCLFIDYGNDGVMTYLYTLSRIYSDNGYYVEISNDFLVDVAFTLSQQREKVIEHISRCLQLDLFDSRMAKLHRILTSVDVQQLYLHAKKKGLGSINPLFSLLGMEENGEQAVPPNEAVGGKNAPNVPLLPPNTPVSPPEVAESPTTAPKVKESKEKKNKEEERKEVCGQAANRASSSKIIINKNTNKNGNRSKRSETDGDWIGNILRSL